MIVMTKTFVLFDLVLFWCICFWFLVFDNDLEKG